MSGNWSKIPNEILDAMATMDGAGAKIAAVLVRQTFGYQRQECRLTWNDLQQATGLSRGGVAIGLEKMAEYGWFVPGRRSTWRVKEAIWARLCGKTVYSVDQNDGENSLVSRPQSTEQTETETETVYSVDQNEVDHSLVTRPPSITERETPSEFQGEKDTAPPPTTAERAIWAAAQALVDRWCDERGISRRPQPDDEGGRLDYYEPAIRLVKAAGADAAWPAAWGAYQAMLAAGYTPARLGPVVQQAIGNVQRQAVPARASPNGTHAVSRDEIIAQALDEVGGW